jgi:cell fate regulator YaaT (PSP1 superfamily)
MPQVAYVEVDDTQHLSCFVPEELSLHEGDQCIVQVGNTTEYGRVLRLEDFVEGARRNADIPKVVRCATLQDHAKADETALMNKMAMRTCEAKAAKYELNMRLVRVRYSFDRAVLTVQFSAEERVDFRQLVKDLSSELRTRIEMRQIGVRDEAAIIGGLGPCGRHLCCCTWLQHFESINVKMAKTQKLTLTPGAINGMCGRLKCCLRYEYEQYKEYSRHLPREGSCVECREGCGHVVNRNILGQHVTVRLEDDRTVQCGPDDIEKVLSDKGRAGKRRPRRGDDTERSGGRGGHRERTVERRDRGARGRTSTEERGNG